MQWFGDHPFSLACESENQVPVPVKEKCLYCEEEIEEGDFGYVTPYLSDTGETQAAQHYECFLRQIVGSIAHQQGRCNCPGSTGEGFGDPEGMTRRQAAKAAARYSEMLKARQKQ